MKYYEQTFAGSVAEVWIHNRHKRFDLCLTNKRNKHIEKKKEKDSKGNQQKGGIMFSRFLEPKMKIAYRNPEAGKEIEALLKQRDAIDARLKEIQAENPVTLEEFCRLAAEARAEEAAATGESRR